MDHKKIVKMLTPIENWIDKTNYDFSDQRQSCIRFESDFQGFYSADFLRDAYFVIVDNIPIPDFPELREIDMGNFIDMQRNGITYKDTYYLKQHDNDVHFHELVHVAQWKFLGARSFIERYILEIDEHGYDEAPLEIMAYYLEGKYTPNGKAFDIPQYVEKNM